MPSVNFNVRIDEKVKKESEEIFNELGINLTTAVNVFLRKAIKAGGFPFDVRLTDSYNQDTIDALSEAERLLHDPTTKRYNVEEALRELKR
ncbi:MAG TPA: type II toxin-antitoxin system RelB/DinJ family antitoxin [Candidatus Fimiplasma intestinipullorum]|uniref:Type II toxin-antitoxin system RelB/DinJ family antitoxin n=1 Tax=Candidatus Fimiplasma intestinipullorum TaxID=2840825 RepID=A0A9D1HQ46_9FIRM|nr:type II toxin-antitoxin system RelB/DinJ family antitoxin [Candidatus Fimiplasma intestinipullorum]